jgi:hypothetical protein
MAAKGSLQPKNTIRHLTAFGFKELLGIYDQNYNVFNNGAFPKVIYSTVGISENRLSIEY